METADAGASYAPAPPRKSRSPPGSPSSPTARGAGMSFGQSASSRPRDDLTSHHPRLACRNWCLISTPKRANCSHLKFRWAARYTSNRCHGQSNYRIFKLPRLSIREIIVSPVVSHLLISGTSVIQSLPRMFTCRNYEPPLCHTCSLFHSLTLEIKWLHLCLA